MLDRYYITVYINPQECGEDGNNNSVHQKLDQIMANIQELTAKVNELQTALDAEQEQIAAAIEALTAEITQLREDVAQGGTVEERQALADRLDSIRADLEGT